MQALETLTITLTREQIPYLAPAISDRIAVQEEKVKADPSNGHQRAELEFLRALQEELWKAG